MYKAVRLFNYKDGIGLEQDALRGVCEVEEHVCTTEDEIISPAEAQAHRLQEHGL